jgi:hypothetical protein
LRARALAVPRGFFAELWFSIACCHASLKILRSSLRLTLDSRTSTPG